MVDVTLQSVRRPDEIGEVAPAAPRRQRGAVATAVHGKERLAAPRSRSLEQRQKAGSERGHGINISGAVLPAEMA